MKYRVTVKSVDKVEKKNNSDNNEIMQESNNIESNSSGESKQKTVSDGGVMMINGLKIISIEPIDNNFSKVRMQIISSSQFFALLLRKYVLLRLKQVFHICQNYPLEIM